MIRKRHSGGIPEIRSGLLAAILSLMLSGAAAGSELPNEVKIKIINDITAEKIKGPIKGDALTAILDAVSQKFSLDAMETPESSAIIERQKAKVRQKYPFTDIELRNQYKLIAEAKYPIYKYGDNVTVAYMLHGKSFYASGTYYKSPDPRYVLVGSKKILKRSILDHCALPFDESKSAAHRDKLVRKKMDEYYQERSAYEWQLVLQQNDNIEHCRKKVKYNGKWMSVRNVIEQKYDEMSAVIADKVMQARKCWTYTKTCRILKSIIRDYPSHKSIPEVESLLSHYRKKQIIFWMLIGIFSLAVICVVKGKKRTKNN